MTASESFVLFVFFSGKYLVPFQGYEVYFQVPGPFAEYTFTSLALHDGSKYKVKVTACNLARLCTTSMSADILHDSSPPTTGV